MEETRTQIWRRLFRKNCTQWEDSDKRRYLSIPNDQDDIDEEELLAARELILEITGKKAIE